MILHPAVIALLTSSILVVVLTLLSSWYGVLILRQWDLASGSSLQLSLERRTYLVSTVLSYLFGFHLFSLFLFIYTAEHLCPLFVGAMCAAGTLNVNAYGYPVLVLKILNFLLAGLWLVMNHADNRAYDYPLIRKKYALLLGIAPLIIGESVLQALYFLDLRPDVITSCCGSLFGAGGKGVASEVAALPPRQAATALFAGMALLLIAGAFTLRRNGKGGMVYALLAGALFVLSIVSILSFLSLYVYELPTHHCPFCVLKEEYHFIGYAYYLTLLGGAVTGMGAGLLAPFRNMPSLAGIIPALQRRLVLLSLSLYGLFLLLVLVSVMTSNLVL